MTRRPSWAIVALAVLGVAGCNCGGPVAGSDAGLPADAGAGAEVDAGHVDAGAADAGEVSDAGIPADAGNLSDAGVPDGGGSTDAGSTDAGGPLDGGPPADAGSPGDAGSPCDGVVCAPLDQCHVAGVCDPSTGMCSNPVAIDGTACTGSNPCFQTNTCQSGVCTGSNPVTCMPIDQCHVAGTCNASTGLCSNTPKPNGSACVGGNLCLQTNVCQSGVCTGSNPVVCSAMDQCHLAGTCNPSTGVCSNPNQTDGTACNDGKSCSLVAVCQSGACTATSSVPCASMVCGTSLTAFNGTQTAGWFINGAASYLDASNTVVLTDGANAAEAGSVFYKDAIAADAFTINFDFRATVTNGRADGIAFVMQTNSPAAVGAAFGGFGAMNLTGYGVELDIFDSGPCDPGNGNHTSVDLLSPCSTNNGVPMPVAASSDLFGIGVGDIGDGAWRTATIQLSGGQLSVTITNSAGTPIAVTGVQGVALPGFTSGTPYYLGLSASDGSNALYARQEIRNVQISFSSTHCL